jgi:hypothetical protein
LLDNRCLLWYNTQEIRNKRWWINWQLLK